MVTSLQRRRRAEGTEEDRSVAEGHDSSLWLKPDGHDSRVRFLLLAEGHDEQRPAGTEEVTTSSDRPAGESKKTEVKTQKFRFRFWLLALAFKNQNNRFI